MPERNMTIAEKARSLRLKRGMSVEEVAQKAGLAATVISGIEEQKLSPPLGTIILLAKALKVPVGDLFGDSADSPFCIVRNEETNVASRFGSTGGTTGGYSYKSLGHQKQNRHMEPFLVTLTPTASGQLEPNRHEGEEILFVLEGQVEIQLADHTEVLKAGDSIYYDSNLPHVVSCHGDKPAKIMAVIYTEQDMLIL